MDAPVVRAPQLLSFPQTVAIALGIAPEPPIAVFPRTPFGWFETVFAGLWALGFLLAFGPRRQTHVDRPLRLAVFRANDVRHADV